MSVKPQSQRLLFMGKQLEDQFNLFDYSVKVTYSVFCQRNVPVKLIPSQFPILHLSSFRQPITDPIHSLTPFLVQLNDLIQLFVRQPLGELENKDGNVPEGLTGEKMEVKKEEVTEVVVEDAESVHWKVGDELDCRDEEGGTRAWFEAVVKRITRNDENAGADQLTYHVMYVYLGDGEEKEYGKLFKVYLAHN